MEVSADVLKAYKLAKVAKKNAHAPYSNFLVGSCLKVKGQDKFYPGSNMENASIGATVCAERGALQTMVTDLGKVEPEFIVVVTRMDPAIGPCGMCLQVLSEFCSDDFPIYLANDTEIQVVKTFKDFLPNSFRDF